jgi:glycosyltransferase involved in cell wall biosynthesis
LKETLLAFEQIATKQPDFKFLAIGHDKYKPKIIEELVKRINTNLSRQAVIYVPYVQNDEDVVALYENAKLFVYVSDNEAFGLPPLESLALGGIPVMADNELSHELVDDKAFFVSKPYDVSSIARALEDGLSNEKKRVMIRYDGQKQVEGFTWKAHAQRFIEMVRAVDNR